MLYSPYDIVFEKVDECPRKGKIQHYFEIVYIVSGHGIQNINQHKVQYQSGDLLLLTPSDINTFDVQETTEFLFVAFHKHYIENNALSTENSIKLEYLLQSASTTKGCIIYNRSDKFFIKSIADGIVRESINKRLYGKALIEQLMNALILMVARNLAMESPEDICETSEGKIVDILQYVQSNIYNPEKISLEKIGSAF